jgi:hypothetical protein
MDAYNSMLFKKEAVYSTDSLPTAIANAALTRDLVIKPLALDRLKRNLDIPARGARREGVANQRMEVDYKLELTGSGAAGMAPRWMEHLEVCGMEAATLVAATSASQKFAALGAPISSATIHGYRGNNQRRRAVGFRGDISAINFTAGEYPYIGIKGIGLLGAVPLDQTALVAPDFSQWKDPFEVNIDNTAFLLDGYAAVMRSYTAQANAEFVLRNLVNSRYVRRGNHEMAVKIVIEAPDLNTKNYFDKLKTGATIQAKVTHGVGAGNIVEVTNPFLQIVDINDSAEGDVAMYEIDALATISAGQDDITIVAK